MNFPFAGFVSCSRAHRRSSMRRLHLHPPAQQPAVPPGPTQASGKVILSRSLMKAGHTTTRLAPRFTGRSRSPHPRGRRRSPRRNLTDFDMDVHLHPPISTSRSAPSHLRNDGKTPLATSAPDSSSLNWDRIRVNQGRPVSRRYSELRRRPHRPLHEAAVRSRSHLSRRHPTARRVLLRHNQPLRSATHGHRPRRCRAPLDWDRSAPNSRACAASATLSGIPSPVFPSSSAMAPVSSMKSASTSYAWLVLTSAASHREFPHATSHRRLINGTLRRSHRQRSCDRYRSCRVAHPIPASPHWATTPQPLRRIRSATSPSTHHLVLRTTNPPFLPGPLPPPPSRPSCKAG